MTSDPCAIVRPDLEALAAGEPPTPAQQIHLDACPGCQAELALARRIERVLATWPTPAPPPHFELTVAAAARRERWRQEQVVDWGFNVALGTGLVALLAGLVGAMWVLGTTASAGPAATSGVLATTATAALGVIRGQATVVGTATLLLTATLGAWWWAEERARW